MDVAEAMSAVVLTIGPAHSVREAARRMVERGVGAAVVEDSDAQGPGILTERDVLRAVAEGVDLDTTEVGGYLTRDAVVASPQMSLDDAARTMLRGGFRHLVVVDGHRTVGVVSVRDVLRCLSGVSAT
jgi:CBS domain-containing protein